ncbi:Lrp/AsnC family transcriptional regulator [Mycolicibacterium sp.]|uniref:Lrp/AsnC family transcriptional regulator n=1 Tax=Mycolicibacterium sp. TaxID=2320850 RepID=UPI003D0D4977
MTSIDALDADLIAALSDDPRISATELAQRFQVSRNTVHARLERLSAAGVLGGFSVRIKLGDIGIPVEAFVDVELAQGALQAVIDALSELPNVLEVHATTGRADLMVRIAATTHEQLQHLLQEMSDIPGVNRSTTHIALSTPVPYRIGPLLKNVTRAVGRGRSGGTDQRR